MQIAFAALGAFIGLAFASFGSRPFDLMIGATLGYAVGELLGLTSRIAALSDEVKRLRARIDRLHADTDSPAPLRSGAPRVQTGTPLGEPSASGTVQGPFRAPPPRVAPEPATAAAAAAEPAPSSTSPPHLRANAPEEFPFVAAFRGFVAGGNSLVRGGVIVLFFGVAFLLRYMAEHTRVPIEIRLSEIAVGSLVMLALGWRLRLKRSGYALALQGGGIGILYLTVFAAMRLYGLLTPAAAFPLLAVVGALSATLALLQDSLAFALLGITGGFLAPVLASTGQGSHVALFSYYALLNCGIVAIAWFKAWRALNVAGFLFTFAIGTAWGVLKYDPDDFASTEPFLVLFFLLYVGIAILFTWRLPARLKGYIDGMLVFGTPIVVFALQAAMLRGRPMELAYSAVAGSAVYVSGIWVLKRRGNPGQRLLIEAFIGIAVALLTLAVPLGLGARWNAVTWALEGSALIWVGCRQMRRLPRVAGALLNLASGLVLARQLNLFAGHLFLPLDAYFGVLAQAAAAAVAAWTLDRHRDRLADAEQVLPDLLFCWGLLWWVIGGYAEIERYLPETSLPALLVFISITTVLCGAFLKIAPLRSALIGVRLQLPAMVFYLLAATDNGAPHPFSGGGWWAWPCTFAAHYWLNFQHEEPVGKLFPKLQHAVSFWLLTFVVGWETAWAIGNVIGGAESWRESAWSMTPIAALLALPTLVARVAWPFARHRSAYLFLAGGGTAVALSLWSAAMDLTSRGDPAPLAYCPLLNPLDIAQAFALLTLTRYCRIVGNTPEANNRRMDANPALTALCVLGFLWLNAALLRTLHYWFAVPLGLRGIMESTLAQTSLSIFWAALALASMVAATRASQRGVWLGGASLLGITVAKLFLVDLSRIGSIERIVSFIGVGILMLVVGFISPIPPLAKQAR